MSNFKTSSRISIINADKCKPKKCGQECKRICPVVMMGKQCIEVSKTSKIAVLSEDLCNGCGLCVKKCPFNALSIINIPKELEKETTHRYGENSFKLHRLPQPRPGQVLGLVGSNGTGKSTALKILAGKMKPNLGRFSKDQPEWNEIVNYFRGSELQNYFQRLQNGNLTAVVKPQMVDILPTVFKGTVADIIKTNNVSNQIASVLELEGGILYRNVEQLSGGELQRLAIAITASMSKDVYMFDEPTSYLDVRQRLRAARVIRSLVENTDGENDKYVICVEHDLAILDYVSDFICCLYGTPSAYGVVSMPFSVREGINIFLDGFIPAENMRFRDETLTFKVAESIKDEIQPSLSQTDKPYKNSYPAMKKTFGGFTLEVEAGNFKESEIVVLLGENGTGKTTFIRLLAGLLKPDTTDILPELKISYKPQTIHPKFGGTVQQLLFSKLGAATITEPHFRSDVIKPLKIEDIYDNEVQTLSGGELQRVALVLSLGTPADVYLIDEPSAYLDSEQRMIAAKVIKRFILHSHKTAFVVEHDFIMATYLADRVIVYEGKPSVHATAKSPQSLLSGMNRFLSNLEITFRRDPTNNRPRINKKDSILDKEQKANGNYFFLDEPIEK